VFGVDIDMAQLLPRGSKDGSRGIDDLCCKLRRACGDDVVDPDRLALIFLEVRSVGTQGKPSCRLDKHLS